MVIQAQAPLAARSLPRSSSSTAPAAPSDGYAGSVYATIDQSIARSKSRQGVAYTVSALGGGTMLAGVVSGAANSAAFVPMMLGGLAAAVGGSLWGMAEGQHITHLAMQGAYQASNDLLLATLRKS